MLLLLPHPLQVSLGSGEQGSGAGGGCDTLYALGHPVPTSLGKLCWPRGCCDHLCCCLPWFEAAKPERWGPGGLPNPPFGCQGRGCRGRARSPAAKATRVCLAADKRAKSERRAPTQAGWVRRLPVQVLLPVSTEWGIQALLLLVVLLLLCLPPRGRRGWR